MWMVSMKAVLDIVSQYCPDDDGSCSKAGVDLREMLDEIEGLDETEVVPVRRGQWINTNSPNQLRCSNCDIIHMIAQYPNGKIAYFPNCGARMDGVGDG